MVREDTMTHGIGGGVPDDTHIVKSACKAEHPENITLEKFSNLFNVEQALTCPLERLIIELLNLRDRDIKFGGNC